MVAVKPRLQRNPWPLPLRCHRPLTLVVAIEMAAAGVVAAVAVTQSARNAPARLVLKAVAASAVTHAQAAVHAPMRWPLPTPVSSARNAPHAATRLPKPVTTAVARVVVEVVAVVATEQSVTFASPSPPSMTTACPFPMLTPKAHCRRPALRARTKQPKVQTVQKAPNPARARPAAVAAVVAVDAIAMQRGRWMATVNSPPICP